MESSRFKVTSDIISKKAIFWAVILFVAITLGRLGYLYLEMQNSKARLAKTGSETLSVLTMEHRDYYQKLFSDGTIPLSDRTLPALPAYSSYDISRRFSKKNFFRIRIQTVSDRARNERNKADATETEAIDYFKTHPDAVSYFRYIDREDGGSFYQYALPLRITQRCLKCHGDPDEAPAFIKKRYKNAYGYKVGDLRGILSIKTPEAKVSAFVAPSFWIQAVYDFVLFIAVFFLVRYLIFKFRTFSHDLEEDVEKKTSQLRQSVKMLDEYKKALDDSAIVSKGDLEGNITYVNDAFCAITGYTKEEVLGKNHNILRHPDTPDEFYEQMWDTLLSKRPWHSLLRNKTKDGGDFYVEANVYPILDAEGEIREFIAIRYDVTELMQKREEIRRSYTVDKLTGLPNRNRFVEDVGRLDNPNIALVNIDGFNAINDFYGIDSGDDLLRQMAQKLASLVQTNLFTLYRLHSDEFAIVGRGVLSAEEFVTLVHHYEQEVENTVFTVYGDEEVTFSISVGFGSGRYALVKADMALKLAKKHKLEYAVYDETMNLERQYESNLFVARQIRKALANGQVTAYYQPIMDMRSGKIVKYEALVRIRDGSALLLPGTFLEVAKKTKQYFKLTKTMIDLVTEAVKRYDVTISINLSIEDLTNAEMVEFLKERLTERAVASGMVFELLENESIDNYDEMLRTIREFKAFGAEIAIDDFGTGYSNFSHVLQLGVDYIKIDGSLVRNIVTDKQSRVLVEGIVEFSKRLGMKTIAEFVESEAILEALRGIGVDYAQGFYIGKPLPEPGRH